MSSLAGLRARTSAFNMNGAFLCAFIAPSVGGALNFPKDTSASDKPGCNDLHLIELLPISSVCVTECNAHLDADLASYYSFVKSGITCLKGRERERKAGRKCQQWLRP